jgi:hypothetical protein
MPRRWCNAIRRCRYLCPKRADLPPIQHLRWPTLPGQLDVIELHFEQYGPWGLRGVVEPCQNCAIKPPG